MQHGLRVRKAKHTLLARFDDIQRVEDHGRHEARRETRDGLDAIHLGLGSSILFLHYDEGVW
jgi:hypothetical protein